MMKTSKRTVMLVAAMMLSLPIFTVEAFSLGGLVESAVKEKVVQNAGNSENNGAKQSADRSTGYAVYSAEETSSHSRVDNNFSGRILVNGVPFKGACIAGCKDMVIERGYKNRLEIRHRKGTPGGTIGVEFSDTDGTFSVRAAEGIPYRMIFWVKGYEPIVMDNLIAPINLGDINLTQPNSDIPDLVWGLTIE